MALLIDKRNQVPADKPGAHVLIVGVSDYLNLPDAGDIPRPETWFLTKLTSAALSAFRIFEWVKGENLRLPLKTVRLLLSPSQSERDAEPGVAAAGAQRADRQNFETDARAWRRDASLNKDDMTCFFFAGHGLQRGPEDGVLLLENFLEADLPPLARCFEVANIRNGMAPSQTFLNIANTQFYFFDACMMRSETLQKFVNPQVPEVFAVELNVTDRREAPLLFSTVDGAIALGRAGKPSFFAEGLLLALKRAAEEAVDVDGMGTVWPVTSMTIKTAIDIFYRKKQVGTDVKIGSFARLPVIRYLPDPPDVELELFVQPDDLGNPCLVSVRDENNATAQLCSVANAVVLPNPTELKRFEFTIKAGIYRVQVDSQKLQAGQYRSPLKMINQKVSPWSHSLGSRLAP